MQRLLQVCCAAVALTALAACSDSTLTSPTGAARAPGARSSVITPTTQTVCSSAATLVDHGQTLPGSGLAAVQVVAPNPNWHTPITLNAVNSIWVIPPGGAFTALNAPDFELSHYQASFSVPANNTATLDGSSFTDNQLTSILVNNTGTSLGSNATLDDSHNYDVNGTALTWSTSGLAAGSYTLDFYVKNNNHVTGTNPTGIDFCFEVVSTPNAVTTWCSPGFWKNHGLNTWVALQGNPYSSLGPNAAPLSKKAPAGDPSLLTVISNPNTYGGPAANSVADFLANLAFGTPIGSGIEDDAACDAFAKGGIVPSV